ncbi:hypothetical protein EV677_2024 [Herminiimonas fonticola]|uniref:Uncharacterized protein n=1 Tax=Herminiimonas fonticola TaxID=303380 RepID=A0A4R6G849_9BURK|nr:hypothetical protein Hfont_1767 [Herminiimonas fonticola]TDN89955.1 hypothetical protein EV677_2024 [Herminiimonas fonticola]
MQCLPQKSHDIDTNHRAATRHRIGNFGTSVYPQQAPKTLADQFT